MYVISYDIDKDKTRTKIAKLLENYGTRVQYSVFECNISQKQYEELYMQLAQLMSGEIEGSIRFYQLCRNCMEKVSILGCMKEKLDDEIEGLFII